MQTIHTDAAPAAIGPYSQAKVVGNLLFVSGSIPLDPTTMNVVGEDIQTQTHQVCKNIEAILKATGSDFEHVAKPPVSYTT